MKLLNEHKELIKLIDICDQSTVPLNLNTYKIIQILSENYTNISEKQESLDVILEKRPSLGSRTEYAINKIYTNMLLTNFPYKDKLDYNSAYRVLVCPEEIKEKVQSWITIEVKKLINNKQRTIHSAIKLINKLIDNGDKSIANDQMNLLFLALTCNSVDLIKKLFELEDTYLEKYINKEKILLKTMQLFIEFDNKIKMAGKERKKKVDSVLNKPVVFQKYSSILVEKYTKYISILAEKYGLTHAYIDDYNESYLYSYSLLDEKKILAALADIKQLEQNSKGQILVSNYLEIFTLLLEKDFNISANNDDISPILYAATHNLESFLNELLKYDKKPIFKKIVNQFTLSGYETIKFELDKYDITQLGVNLYYKTNFSKHFTWEDKVLEVKKELALENIELIDEQNSTYLIKVYNNSKEAKLIKSLTIEGKKPEFVNFLEKNHTTYILFKNIPGVTIDSWKKQKTLIEDLLNLPVNFERYDHSHELWKQFGTEELILIKESNISVMPEKLKLGGSYLKVENNHGVDEYYFKDVDDIQLWTDNLQNIITYINEELEILDKGNGVVILRKPMLPSVDDKVSTISTRNIARVDQLFLGIKDKSGNNQVYTDENSQTKNKLSGSILVSGMSGSGKSFTINNIIKQYIYNYEAVDQIVIFNFKSDAAFDWLKPYAKVKIIDGSNSPHRILQEFMRLQLKMNMKYAYLKEYAKGLSKNNFLENFNSLIIIDEAQTIPNKINTTKGQELEVYERIEEILQDIAAKIRATADSMLISTQLPKLSTIPGGTQVRENLRHNFCGKGTEGDIADAIPLEVLNKNKVVTSDLKLGQMLYYDKLTGRFEQVFVQENKLTDEDSSRVLNYIETEHNNQLLEKFSSLKEIAILADKLQQENTKNTTVFNSLEEMESYQEVDVFELAKQKLEEKAKNSNTISIAQDTAVIKETKEEEISDNFSWDDEDVLDTTNWDDEDKKEEDIFGDDLDSESRKKLQILLGE